MNCSNSIDVSSESSFPILAAIHIVTLWARVEKYQKMVSSQDGEGALGTHINGIGAVHQGREQGIGLRHSHHLPKQGRLAGCRM